MSASRWDFTEVYHGRRWVPIIGTIGRSTANKKAALFRLGGFSPITAGECPEVSDINHYTRFTIAFIIMEVENFIIGACATKFFSDWSWSGIKTFNVAVKPPIKATIVDRSYRV